jgi:hypothetical protein
MAQHIVTLCDVHLMDSGEQVAGRQWEMGWRSPDNPRWVWFLIDLCEEHATNLSVAPHDAEQFLGKYGRTHEAPSTQTSERSTPPETCPRCGFRSRNRAALRSHVNANHLDTTLDQLEGTATPFQCEHCPRAYTRAQGLALHTVRTHKMAVQPPESAPSPRKRRGSS